MKPPVEVLQELWRDCPATEKRYLLNEIISICEEAAMSEEFVDSDYKVFRELGAMLDED